MMNNFTLRKASLSKRYILGAQHPVCNYKTHKKLKQNLLLNERLDSNVKRKADP